MDTVNEFLLRGTGSLYNALESKKYSRGDNDRLNISNR